MKPSLTPLGQFRENTGKGYVHELSKRLKVSRTFIASVEGGRVKPSLALATAYSKLLGLTLEQFMEMWRKARVAWFQDELKQLLESTGKDIAVKMLRTEKEKVA